MTILRLALAGIGGWRIPPWVTAGLYMLAWAASLGVALGGLPLGHIAGMAIMLFLIGEFPRQKRFAQALFLGLVASGLIALIWAASPIGTFFVAWERGATYAAFFFALGGLRDAAETSPTVRRCGQHLVAQPPGRRYIALTAGGHVFSIILSYGAIELFGAMVARANTLVAAGGSADIQAIRTRRMLLAVYRGFATMNCWSPLNIMTAVVSTAVPAAPMRLLLPVAIVVAIAMMAVGWLMDRLAGSRLPTRGSSRPATTERWSIHLRIVLLVALVMGGAELVAATLGVLLVTGVTLVVPVVGLGWLVLQSARIGRLAPALMVRRLGRFYMRIPTFRGEATVLGASGFFGVALAAALPANALTGLLASLPPITLPLMIPPLLLATGQVGLNPVAVVAVVGATIPDPRAFGVSPAVLAFSCMLGWGVAANMTPMSASAITTARWAGVHPWTVSTVWNGPYTLAAMAVGWLAIIAMSFAAPVWF